jgi:formylglycine-generating enzyme required for sulfatase activity
MTGKPYRLLSEAEYEYAARAGAQTAYPWGDEVGRGNASCNGCGSKWDNLRPAPVGSFAANRFGLFDMVGNILAWVDDCYHPNYEGSPPVDGTPWITGDCSRRVDRGGHWYDLPEFIRSAARDKGTPDRRGFDLGIRVGRTLDLPPQNH